MKNALAGLAVVVGVMAASQANASVVRFAGGSSSAWPLAIVAVIFYLALKDSAGGDGASAGASSGASPFPDQSGRTIGD